MTDEIWKDILGYESLYQVSSFGRVRSVDKMVWGGRKFYLKKGEIKKLQIGTTGYWSSMLYKNNKHKIIKVHREVAIAFIPNPDNKPFINHKDLNKLNANITNLEWCTHKENAEHASNSGVYIGRTNIQARHHCTEKLLAMATLMPFKTQRELTSIFNTNKTLIADIKRGHCYLSLREIFKTTKENYNESNRAGHFGVVKTQT
jgi:hypothetical protein